MYKSMEPEFIGDLQLNNRWVMLAMHTGYADENGGFSQKDKLFYKERAKGGMAAITLVGAVNEEGSQENMHILNIEENKESLADVCNIINDEDVKVIMQLFHAGRNKKRYSESNQLPLCPSPIPSPIYKEMPKEMTQDDIERTISAFGDAAVFCKNAGVDCVEISMSAGYLISQFFSPFVNKRSDQWGVNCNRGMNFATAVLKDIRHKVGDKYPVIIKISSGDMLGGYGLDYMIDFINQLEQGTIMGVTVTGGWHEAPVPQISYHVKPGGFVKFAKMVRDLTNLPVIACNRINSLEVGEEIINNEMADFVGAARGFLIDPLFLKKQLNNKPHYKCQGCNKGCIERVLRGKDVKCAFNPKVGKECINNNEICDRKKILVVGAGPVGLETGKIANEFGYDVTVVTNENKAGGTLRAASKPPFKHDLNLFVDTLEDELNSKSIKIFKSVNNVKKIIDEIEPDKVIFATGAEPIKLSISGSENINQYTAEELLMSSEVDLGKHVIVIGGGSVGLETAEYIVTHNTEINVTVVEMGTKVGNDLGGLKWILMKSLKEKNVDILTESKLIYCERKKAVIRNHTQTIEKMVDTIIFAVGSKPRKSIALDEYLKCKNIPYYIVGDGDKPGNVMTGLENAYNLISSFNE